MFIYLNIWIDKGGSATPAEKKIFPHKFLWVNHLKEQSKRFFGGRRIGHENCGINRSRERKV